MLQSCSQHLSNVFVCISTCKMEREMWVWKWAPKWNQFGGTQHKTGPHTVPVNGDNLDKELGVLCIKVYSREYESFKLVHWHTFTPAYLWKLTLLLLLFILRPLRRKCCLCKQERWLCRRRAHANSTMFRAHANSTTFRTLANSIMFRAHANSTMFRAHANSTMFRVHANSTMFRAYANSTMFRAHANSTMFRAL